MFFFFRTALTIVTLLANFKLLYLFLKAPQPRGLNSVNGNRCKLVTRRFSLSSDGRAADTAPCPPAAVRRTPASRRARSNTGQRSKPQAPLSSPQRLVLGQTGHPVGSARRPDWAGSRYRRGQWQCRAIAVSVTGAACLTQLTSESANRSPVRLS